MGASQEQLLKDLEIKHKQKLTEEAKLTPLLQSIVDLRSKKESERRSNLDSACVSGLLTLDPAAARRKREEQRLAILDEAKAKQLKREKERLEKEKARKEAEEKARRESEEKQRKEEE